MPRFTLIRFDRYEAAKSEVIYHNTYETNLGLAFKEALGKLWQADIDVMDRWQRRIEGYKDQIGIDFEEHSYLFFES